MTAMKTTVREAKEEIKEKLDAVCKQEQKQEG